MHSNVSARQISAQNRASLHTTIRTVVVAGTVLALGFMAFSSRCESGIQAPTIATVVLPAQASALTVAMNPLAVSPSPIPSPVPSPSPIPSPSSSSERSPASPPSTELEARNPVPIEDAKQATSIQFTPANGWFTGTSTAACLASIPSDVHICGQGSPMLKFAQKVGTDQYVKVYKPPPIIHVPGDRVKMDYTGNMLPAFSATVVEIGGNTGDDTRRWVVRKPGILHVYEPIPPTAAKLEAKVNKWRSDLAIPKTEAHVHPFAMGAKDMTAKLYSRTAGFVDASMDRSRFPPNAALKEVNMTVKAVVEEITSLNLPRISLLAMNCEGCEYEVLPALICSGLIDKIDYLFFATHSATQPDHANILCKVQAMLTRTHYATMVHQNWRAFSPREALTEGDRYPNYPEAFKKFFQGLDAVSPEVPPYVPGPTSSPAPSPKAKRK